MLEVLHRPRAQATQSSPMFLPRGVYAADQVEKVPGPDQLHVRELVPRVAARGAGVGGYEFLGKTSRLTRKPYFSNLRLL